MAVSSLPLNNANLIRLYFIRIDHGYGLCRGPLLFSLRSHHRCRGRVHICSRPSRIVVESRGRRDATSGDPSLSARLSDRSLFSFPAASKACGLLARLSSPDIRSSAAGPRRPLPRVWQPSVGCARCSNLPAALPHRAHCSLQRWRARLCAALCPCWPLHVAAASAPLRPQRDVCTQLPRGHRDDFPLPFRLP